MIAVASDPVAEAAAWRTDPDDRYDFSADRLRLEVKSTATRKRVHSFSYEQSDVPEGCQGVVVSLFIERSAGGTTLEDLILIIASRLVSSPATIFRVEQVLASTLGSSLPEALSFAFDMELARSELAFFDLREIPAIRSLPPSVSQVRFASDLSTTSKLDIADFSGLCPAIAAFVAISA